MYSHPNLDASSKCIRKQSSARYKIDNKPAKKYYYIQAITLFTERKINLNKIVNYEFLHFRKRKFAWNFRRGGFIIYLQPGAG